MADALYQSFPLLKKPSFLAFPLIKMDIMVRDERVASTGGWGFGTYVQNGKLNSEDS